MTGLTESERRGARLLALLLLLGTANDLWQARHPRMSPVPAGEERRPGEAATMGAAVPETEPVAARAEPARPERMDLNRASAADLDRLPGIGPVLAARIVEHRRHHGAFRHVDELLGVPGIGPRLLERLRPALLEPPGAVP